ncbi:MULTISPECIES: ornithine aminomutase subunit alpha [Caloramator]|jgi:D-ornithine 4,5-aminomutase subunit alpha|uniref:D-Ornithine 4,5-aminomutase S subunit n=1 Tax=Caloramator australicus RC3 TaxID=857293 RepID=I7KWQ7_9CLOT|nr:MULTISPECIES: ornithine aminomutase subunit alpha [Caloramator]MCX7904597.1 ornithine aminomutase subunit alpha [Caloramator sp.]MDO6354327.1 ornithine aminomutase subunit alpha [Caloramator sp. CAR-1]WDU84323.1 ornithine aminomutase subunit alpha [Caloramator sp. Dgby_cultured_2]CCJ34656.1 D-Ornithine 4,5-aminomutase S subunit [Caloramator australicus RC3]
MSKRPDDFEVRRQHLKNLTDEELERRFWQLAEEIVKPLVELAYNHTSPAVERSVLLRMGFSSIEAKAIVEGVMKLGLLGKGAGNVVYRLAKKKNLPIREAGLLLVEGKAWEEVPGLFEGGAANA